MSHLYDKSIKLQTGVDETFVELKKLGHGRGWDEYFFILRASVQLAFSILTCGIHVSFWSKCNPRSLAEWRIRI